MPHFIKKCGFFYIHFSNKSHWFISPIVVNFGNISKQKRFGLIF